MIPAKNFCQTLAMNVDNPKLSDAAFRQIARNTLPEVEGCSKSTESNVGPYGDGVDQPGYPYEEMSRARSSKPYIGPYGDGVDQSQR